MSKGRGMPKVCPCGLNPRRYPHDLRICAPALERRLQKYAFYLRQFKYQNLNSSYWITSKGVWMTVFPDTPQLLKCVICEESLYSWHRGGMVYQRQTTGLNARICSSCGKDAIFCFYHMKEGLSSCIQPTSRMIFLCLLRKGIPIDVVRMIVKQYVFTKQNLCIHDQ
jgi:hypothetical protein